MKLQVAIDFMTPNEALKLIGEIEDLIDIVEIGTPLIMREGVSVISKVKKEFPSLSILADMKIMDAGQLESKMAFDAGADLVTVLGVANNLTIEAVIAQARYYQKQVMVDMIEITDVISRSLKAEEMGADYICIHAAYDSKSSQDRSHYNFLHQLKSKLKSSKLAVAGGINITNIENVIVLPPEIIIIGGGITKTNDRRHATTMLKKALTV